MTSRNTSSRPTSIITDAPIAQLINDILLNFYSRVRTHFPPWVLHVSSTSSCNFQHRTNYFSRWNSIWAWSPLGLLAGRQAKPILRCWHHLHGRPDPQPSIRVRDTARKCPTDCVGRVPIKSMGSPNSCETPSQQNMHIFTYCDVPEDYNVMKTFLFVLSRRCYVTGLHQMHSPLCKCFFSRFQLFENSSKYQNW